MTWAKLTPTFVTLIAAATGGIALTLMDLPASWLTGGMIGAAALAMSGVRTEIYPPIRNVGFLVLGGSLGTTVSPDIIEGISHWPLTMAAVIIGLAAMQVTQYLYLKKVAGWDKATALFAAVPGVTSYVIAIALQTRAIIPRVAIVHTLRTFTLIIALPPVLSIVETEQLDMVRRLPGDLYSTAATLGAAALIGLVFDRLRMPGGFLLGGLLGSGTVHFFDWASGSLPNAVLIAGFIVLGGAIGSRFSGNTVRTLGAVFVTASAVIAIGFGISLVLAFGMSLVVGRSFAELTLAFSPGAIDVTAVLAFSLGLDSVFVAAHQLFRFCLIAATLSAGGWWFARDRKDDEETP